MLVYPDEVELVCLSWVKVKATDVLVDTVGLCGAECIDIRARIRRGNICFGEIDRDGVERACRHYALESGKAGREGIFPGCASRNIDSCWYDLCGKLVRWKDG